MAEFFPIEKLPKNIVGHMAQFLDVKDICTLKRVNKNLNKIITELDDPKRTRETRLIASRVSSAEMWIKEQISQFNAPKSTPLWYKIDYLRIRTPFVFIVTLVAVIAIFVIFHINPVFVLYVALLQFIVVRGIADKSYKNFLSKATLLSNQVKVDFLKRDDLIQELYEVNKEKRTRTYLLKEGEKLHSALSIGRYFRNRLHSKPLFGVGIRPTPKEAREKFQQCAKRMPVALFYNKLERALRYTDIYQRKNNCYDKFESFKNALSQYL